MVRKYEGVIVSVLTYGFLAAASADSPSVSYGESNPTGPCSG
jgi:hypothetical protein